MRVSCIRRLAFGILELDVGIHTMALDTHMRVPDIRTSHGDNSWLASSLSPQFGLKMHLVTGHDAIIVSRCYQ